MDQVKHQVTMLQQKFLLDVILGDRGEHRGHPGAHIAQVNQTFVFVTVVRTESLCENLLI